MRPVAARADRDVHRHPRDARGGAAAPARAPRAAAGCRGRRRSAPPASRRAARAARAPSRCRAVRRTPGRRRLAPGRGQLGDQARQPARAAAGAGRQHQRERARRRRAVLERDPAGQLDQLDRHVGLDGAPRREQPLGRDLAALGERDDDAEQLAAPERHDEHRADADAVAHLFGQGVVERPTQRARARERLDLGDRGHRRRLERGAVVLESCGGLEGLCFVGVFPGEVGVFAAEVAVGGGCLVDWAVELEFFAEGAGA